MSATKAPTEPIFTNPELIALIKNGDPVAHCGDILKSLSHEELIGFSMLLLFRIGQMKRPHNTDPEGLMIQLITGINFGLTEYNKASLSAMPPMGNA